MRYKPVRHLSWAQLRAKPAFTPHQPRTAAPRRGVKYEQKVHDRLAALFGVRYTPSQWIQYGADGRVSWIQIDGILVLDNPGRICLLEVKYSHTAEAYWQLENCYLPI